MKRVERDHGDVVKAVLEEVTSPRAAHRPPGRGPPGPRRAPGPRPVGLELERRQAGPRAPVLGRAGHLGRAHHPVRTPVRRAGAGLPGRGRRRAPADRGRVVPRAHGHRRPGPRHRHRAGPARLLPALARRTPARPSPSWSRTGVLRPVTVDGWKRPAYLHVEAKLPRWVRARALLSPFDSLVWQRDRTEHAVRHGVPAGDLRAGAPAGARLLRAAVPAAATRWSARVDLKSDRAADGGEGVLRVNAAHAQPRRAARDGRGAGRRAAASWPAGWAWPGSTVSARGDLAPSLAAGAQPAVTSSASRS